MFKTQLWPHACTARTNLSDGPGRHTLTRTARVYLAHTAAAPAPMLADACTRARVVRLLARSALGDAELAHVVRLQAHRVDADEARGVGGVPGALLVHGGQVLVVEGQRGGARRDGGLALEEGDVRRARDALQGVWRGQGCRGRGV